MQDEHFTLFFQDWLSKSSKFSYFWIYFLLFICYQLLYICFKYFTASDLCLSTLSFPIKKNISLQLCLLLQKQITDICI